MHAALFGELDMSDSLSRALIEVAEEEYNCRAWVVLTTLDDSLIIKNSISMKMLFEFIKKCRLAGNTTALSPLLYWLIYIEMNNVRKYYPKQKIIGVDIIPVEKGK